MKRCFTLHLIKYYFVCTERQDHKQCHDILMRIIHHLTTTTHPPHPPYLNSPAGQLHLYVNTHLSSDSPHMATNNVRKSLGFTSKLCSSQFGQICFMPLSYYPADERTKHVSWQEQSVWSQISCGGNQANGTNTMDAKMFFFFLMGKGRQRSAQFCAQNPVVRG